MQIDDEDREGGPARTGFGPALRTGCLTALVFASAALLALALTGPRFEARATISFADGALPQIGDGSGEISKTEFGSSLAARLRTSDAWQSEASSFRQRFAALLSLDRTRAGEGGGDLASRLAVDSDREAGTLTITAKAGDAQEARVLADAAAAELAERWSALQRPASIGSDDERAAALEALADLRREASNADATDAAPVAGRLAALRVEEDKLRDRSQETSGRLDRLRAFAMDPLAQVSPEDIQTPGLQALLERYRALALSIDTLATTLPAESPRLRIARLHLRELSDQIRADVAPLVGRAERQARALGERITGLAAEIATLEEALLALRAQDRRAVDHAALLAAAEARLATLDAARSERLQEPAAVVVGTAEPALPVPHPFVQVGFLAALTGFAVGFAGSALKMLAGRRVSAASEKGLPSEDTREIEENAGAFLPAPSVHPVPDEAERAEMTLGEAVAALAASSISRTLVAGIEGADGSAASLLLARALARDGQLVLLIDLSPTQAAIAEAGVPQGSQGLGDIVSGAVGFASVTIADESSGADLVPAGRKRIEPSVRNEALRFARRAYDQVVVECGAASATELHALADENAAILLASNGSEPDKARSKRLREFEAAGLDVAILLV